ncbi:MAG: preprotein translocase subunit YajC [Steroidobacteraceae bacterium]
MNSLIPPALAAQGASASAGSHSQIPFILLMVAIFVMFYFVLFRPQQKKQKEHQSLVSKLATGDEVITTGGLLGKIIGVGDSFVTLEIADGVRIKVQKTQVSALMPKGTLKSA